MQQFIASIRCVREHFPSETTKVIQLCCQICDCRITHRPRCSVHSLFLGSKFVRTRSKQQWQRPHCVDVFSAGIHRRCSTKSNWILFLIESHKFRFRWIRAPVIFCERKKKKYGRRDQKRHKLRCKQSDDCSGDTKGILIKLISRRISCLACSNVASIARRRRKHHTRHTHTHTTSNKWRRTWNNLIIKLRRFSLKSFWDCHSHFRVQCALRTAYLKLCVWRSACVNVSAVIVEMVATAFKRLKRLRRALPCGTVIHSLVLFTAWAAMWRQLPRVEPTPPNPTADGDV